MTFADYLEQYGFTYDAITMPEIKQVRDEVAEHLFRNSANALISAKRPTESTDVQGWRVKNKRLIHHEIFETLFREAKAQLREQDIQLNHGSDVLKTWVRDSVFTLNGSQVELMDYYLDCIMVEQTADPNAYVFIKPVSADGVSNPALTGTETEQVKLSFYIVKSDKIKQSKDKDVFIYEDTEKRKYEVNGRRYEDFYYWALDKNIIYRLEPIGRDNNNKIQYDPVVWYVHNLNQLPVVIMPGETAKNAEGKSYQETGFKTCIAYLNEFVNSFSDDQWMRLKNNFATLVLPEIQCSTCNGESYVLTNDGRKPCTACGGSGKMRSPGLSEFIVLPNTDFSSDKVDSRKPYYLSPDIGSLQHSWSTTFELLDKAAAVVGINPLIRNAESGEAMKMRMEKWNVTLNYMYQKMFNFIQDVLEIVEGYLVVNPDNREYPYLKILPEITYRNPEYLKLRYQDSLPIERRSAVIEYLETKYKYDPIKLKIFKVLALYYPVTIMTADELRDALAFGTIINDDIVNGKEAELRLIQLGYNDPDFVETSTERIIYERLINEGGTR